jgi:hypothetical protein
MMTTLLDNINNFIKKQKKKIFVDPETDVQGVYVDNTEEIEDNTDREEPKSSLKKAPPIIHPESAMQHQANLTMMPGSSNSFLKPKRRPEHPPKS